MSPEDIPERLLEAALLLQDLAAKRLGHAHVLEAWSKHLAQDARGLALVVQALEPLPEL